MKTAEECGICFELYSTTTNGLDKVTCARGHTFCADCFRKYAEETIFGLGKTFVSCMARNCREKYSEDSVKRHLGRKLFKRMRENAVTSCTCDCKCCDWKQKRSPVSTDAKERLEREERLTNRSVRRCPLCEKAVLKESGCDHMICSSCDTHFCYSCGDRLTGADYTHVCFQRAQPMRDDQWHVDPVEHHPPPRVYWHDHTRRAERETLTTNGNVSWRGVPLRVAQMDKMRREYIVLPSDPMHGQLGGNSTLSPLFRMEPTLVEKRLKEATRMTNLFKTPTLVIGAGREKNE